MDCELGNDEERPLLEDQERRRSWWFAPTTRRQRRRDQQSSRAGGDLQEQAKHKADRHRLHPSNQASIDRRFCRRFLRILVLLLVPGAKRKRPPDDEEDVPRQHQQQTTTTSIFHRTTSGILWWYLALILTAVAVESAVYFLGTLTARYYYVLGHRDGRALQALVWESAGLFLLGALLKASNHWVAGRLSLKVLSSSEEYLSMPFN
jgi:hypothetical protein